MINDKFKEWLSEFHIGNYEAATENHVFGECLLTSKNVHDKLLKWKHNLQDYAKRVAMLEKR